VFAADKLAKWYETVVTEPVEPAPGLGTYMPPGPLLKRHFAEIETDMKLVGEKMTPSQRAAGVKLAAALVRNNPNCCAWP
jgi:hypothetical protein